MKYELKRPTKSSIIAYSVLIIIGLLCLLFFEYYAGALLITVSAGLIINEYIRSKDKKLTFDEAGFCVGGTRYNYSDIERIESDRFKYTTYIRIIVNNTVIYKFDNGYKGTKEFVKQLTLNGVDHNLFN